VVGTATRVRAEQAGVRMPAGARDVSLLPKVKTGFGAHRPLYSMSASVLSLG